tara:strand:- start:6192 stop:8096 length:1905 start_codon:yes stop_codon:yes gene_type:complete
MAQDSIAYGESLLADVRSRNAKEQKRVDSRAKKDFWKGAAVKIGLKVAEDIMGQRQTAFLNNEENMANKLRTTKAYDQSTTITAREKEAQGFDGGYDAYWVGQANTEVDAYLQTKFAPGTYNPSAYALHKKQLSSRYGQELAKQHKEELQYTNDFLSAGGSKDAYNDLIKKSKAGTLTGALSNWIGKSTGVLDADLHNDTIANLLESSDKLTGYNVDKKSYENAYAQTGDSALSVFIAEQNLGRSDLGTKPPTLGPVTMVKSSFGVEIPTITVQHFKANGQPSHIDFVRPGSDGTINLDTPQATATRQPFDLLSSQILTATGPEQAFLDAGKDGVRSVTKERSELLTEALEQKVKDAGHKSTSKIGQEMLKAEFENVGAVAGAVIYRANNEKWAQAGNAKLIAGEMVAQAYEKGNADRALSGAGLRNPYHTMFAIEGVINAQRMTNTDGMGKLGGRDNALNLYEAYRTETVDGRKAIDDALKANKNFEGKVGPLFGEIHETIKSLIADGTEGTDETLYAKHTELFGKKIPDSTSKVPVVPEEVVEEEAVETVMSVIPAPAKFNRREERAVTIQRTAYKDLLKGKGRVQKLEEKLGGLEPTDAVFDMLNIRKKRASKEFQNLYSQYMKNYGPAEE